MKSKSIQRLLLAVMFAVMSLAGHAEPALTDSTSTSASDDINNVISDFGIDLLEQEIDDVIFQTNSFLTDATFVDHSGPFWWILQICEALAGIFCICMIANMGYKMMAKGEGLDILKLMRPLAISVVLTLWYPGPGRAWCVMDFLAYGPNCIGSYTKDLYMAESVQLESNISQVNKLIEVRDKAWKDKTGAVDAAHNGLSNPEVVQAGNEGASPGLMGDTAKDASENFWTFMIAGGTVFIDKIIMLIALITYRIGWWATIYIQQIMLGMLTIFGPIQWVFSILPKWEGAWAKWTIRYLTVHLYGAMIYFVGFYVLLLFDVVLALQREGLEAAFGAEAEDAASNAYFQNCIFSAGYLMAASVVAVKCLALVPDLASWMIPEGETTFSARSFGEGVGSQVGGKATGMLKGFVPGGRSML